MKLKTLTSLIVTTYICFNSVAQASAPQPVFTPTQEARIGEIAAEYLVSHPEVLVAVSQKLQAQQEARQQLQFAVRVMDNQVALLNDTDTPAFGPENAKVAVIEFFDYQCVHCSSVAPELEKVMKTHPDVRYIFKEWPIFADRWENSRAAAERGLSVWKQKGAEALICSVVIPCVCSRAFWSSCADSEISN
ncbi:thioredoxin domain-containing protein [Leclercia adecarboxylata]|uniref:DsbA family protein n=1 Tax=Leclercia adecarboxylata TaxID=83655 RepID=UPI00384B6776